MSPNKFLPINGTILINKPQGLSSHGVVKKVKYLFNAAKAGHTGSLDPLATGMLPICLGEATKFCSYLLAEDKSYQAIGKFGAKTATGDSLGEVIAENKQVEISEAQLQQALLQFKGEIYQTPPMYSALKHQGVPLYKLARAGKSIERNARLITIYHLELIKFDLPYFEILISCSKGTYIRTLIEDIAAALNLYAHMTALHREHTAGFQQEPMYSLDDLSTASSAENLARLLPVDRAIDYFPIILISQTEVEILRQGKIIENNSASIGSVRLYHQQTFVGLGEVFSPGQIKAKRMLAF